MTGNWILSYCATLLVLTGAQAFATGAPADPAKARITVLYDAFGDPPAMQRDWGYAVKKTVGSGGRLFIAVVINRAGTTPFVDETLQNKFKPE